MSGLAETHGLLDNSGRAVKFQTDIPHLVNIGGDRLSASVTLHPIPQGSRMTLGCGPNVDLHIQGTGVLPLHCHIENSEGVVTIYPVSNLGIDGSIVTTPTRLSQGVIITIGRSHYLKFNHPEEAKLMKTVFPNPRLSMAAITFESESTQPAKVNKKPPAIPKKKDNETDDLTACNIMTKVSKFEYLAQQNLKSSISPKVFSSNSVTVNTPAKDVLGKSPPYFENMSQNVVNYSCAKCEDKNVNLDNYDKKRPHYVNVIINERNNVNNIVAMYENTAFYETKNKNFSRMETELSSCSHKNSPSHSGYDQTVDFNNAHSNPKVQKKYNEATQVEQARLEEILNICVEYEKQAHIEKSKIVPNKIKTNGSLPRDKRQYGGPFSPIPSTPPVSPNDVEFNETRRKNISMYENVTVKPQYKYDTDNFKNLDDTKFKFETSPEDTKNLPPHHSPRTRIRTIAPSSKEGKSPDIVDVIENKFAVLKSEYFANKERNENIGSNINKFIFPLDESQGAHSTKNGTNSIQREKIDIEKIKKEHKAILKKISSIRQKKANTEIIREELQGHTELEQALISGEYQSKLLEIENLRRRREKLLYEAQELEHKMVYSRTKQVQDQVKCKEKLDNAQHDLDKLEELLAQTPKNDPSYEGSFEEYLNAQEVFDNERKTFEDLEFHHLEEEADLLASREEVQRSIKTLNMRINELTDETEELELQKNNHFKNYTSEIAALMKRVKEFERQEVELSNLAKSIENNLSVFANQESDNEESSDNENDKSQVLAKLSNLSLNVVHDLSCSVIISDTRDTKDFVNNMSQSFNEKLLQEKSVLEYGKFPSQDDIDRISKVTLDAPINIGEERGSPNSKIIESLKDIERQRHVLLCQQGSQVIEQERQRVLALKQKVQQEVRTQWALDKQETSKIRNDSLNASLNSNQSNLEEQAQPVQEETSSRPISNISESSGDLEVVGKKRTKQIDKQRPLTRYLPISRTDLDLRQHIELAGHQVELCPHVVLNSTTCKGFLHKRGSKLNVWSRRWFVFDRIKRVLIYHNDKSEKKVRGGAYFQAIQEVYLDHFNNVKSPNPHLTFIVKTNQRLYYLMAPSPEAMRIWVDVIFTGAEGYQGFLNES